MTEKSDQKQYFGRFLSGKSQGKYGILFFVIICSIMSKITAMTSKK